MIKKSFTEDPLANREGALKAVRDLEIVKLSDIHDKCRSDFSPTTVVVATSAVGLKSDLHSAMFLDQGLPKILHSLIPPHAHTHGNFCRQEQINIVDAILSFSGVPLAHLEI